MAKKVNPLATLANAIAGAFETVETSGGLVETICASVQNLYKGEEVPTADADFIADEVGRLRGWDGNSARVRKSECKSVLGQYALLPEAIERANRKKHVSFDAAVKLARSLNKGMTPNQAAQAYIKGNAAQKAAPNTVPREDAEKRAASSIKNVLKYTKLPPKFRSELRTLCEDHGLAV